MNLILPATQILNELKYFEPRAFDEPSDEKFLCPELPWLRDEFGPWCVAHIPPYVPGKRDCEDRVEWALVQAADALVKNTAVVDCGKALFRCDVLLPPAGLNGVRPQDGQRSHATGFVRTAQGWVFWEPPNGQITMAVDWLDGFDALDFVLVRVRL